MKQNKKTLILKNLRSNARASFSQISRKTGIPVTTVYDNYKRLLEDNYITKHTSLVNFRKLGYNYRSFVFVKARNKQEMLSFLQENNFVNSIYEISHYDYLADVVCPGIKDFYDFLDRLRDFGLLKLELHDIVEHEKAESFISHE